MPLTFGGFPVSDELSLRLKQALIEFQYGKHTIKELIMKEVKEDLGDVIAKGAELIKDYVNSDFYEGKGDRVRAIRTMNYIELVTSMLCTAITIEVPEPIQRMVTSVANLLPYSCRLEAARTAAELIVVVSKTKLYDVILAADSETGTLQLVSNFLLDEGTRTEIMGKKYLPPMVCKPNLVDSNLSNSHLTMGEKSLVLGKGNHHYEPLSYDAINIANGVELELNYDIIDNCIELPKHPERKEDEKRSEHRERIDSHDQMVLESKLVYEQLRGNSFYFGHSYDMRGRQYTDGYHVNNQGNEFKKASIQLKTKHIITGV